jgi:hypothetical protein
MKMIPRFLALGMLAATLAPLRAADPYAPLKYKPICTHGQALVDMEMARHPELKLITVHITPRGIPTDSAKDRCILCSSIGRFGKPDAGPDGDVVTTGKEQVEIDRHAPGANPFAPTAPPKYEVLTPLLARSGKIIGLLVVVFPWKEGVDTDKLHQVAMQIRDDFKERTADKDDLLRPAS